LQDADDCKQRCGQHRVTRRCHGRSLLNEMSRSLDHLIGAGEHGVGR
jgi:hypothetical protein